MKLLLEMLYGFGLTAEVYTSPRRYPRRGGFTTDARKLRGDVRVVGRDVKMALSMAREQQQDGQSAHTTEGAVTQR
jgi:hypothetical protein